MANKYVPLPAWSIIDLRLVEEFGRTGAHHTVQDLPRVFLPIFSTEEKARKHAVEWGVPEIELRQIEDAEDLRITLEVFKGRDGTHIAFDQDFGGAGVRANTVQDVIDDLIV